MTPPTRRWHRSRRNSPASLSPDAQTCAPDFVMPDAAFTEEQTQYLQGFLAGSGLTRSLPVLPAAPAQKSAGEPASDDDHRREQGGFLDEGKKLCSEEMAKREKNPLDAWDDLCDHAREGRFPKGPDVFRFKFHGLFYVAPAQDSFMLRLRTPGCVLHAHQMRGLARMAEDWGAGEAHITTRGNIQIREFQPKDIVRVLMEVQSLGMSSRGSGADNIRNITATPTSGLDPRELCDVAPLAQALNFYILNSRDLYGLPRKFN